MGAEGILNQFGYSSSRFWRSKYLGLPSCADTLTWGVIAPDSCTAYIENTGCGWTGQYNCPGQSPGTNGAATDDGSTGYACCCNEQMWKPRGPPICQPYMATQGCAWTKEWNCPGENAGSKGAATSDGSLGYDCCCVEGLWKPALGSQALVV